MCDCDPLGPQSSHATEECAKVHHGLPLRERDAHNFELTSHPSLLLKDSYWRWPERNLAGNAIDFCVQVLGLTFHDAMRALLRT